MLHQGVTDLRGSEVRWREGTELRGGREVGFRVAYSIKNDYRSERFNIVYFILSGN